MEKHQGAVLPETRARVRGESNSWARSACGWASAGPADSGPPRVPPLTGSEAKMRYQSGRRWGTLWTTKLKRQVLNSSC